MAGKIRKCIKKKNFFVKLYNLKRKLIYTKIIISTALRRSLFEKNKLWKIYFWDRLGIYSPELLKNLKKPKTILIHANSGGEVFGIQELLKCLQNKFKTHNILFATDGFEPYTFMNKHNFGNGVIFFPWDFNRTCKKVIKRLKIKTVLYLVRLMHPDFIDECKKMGVPQLLIDGYMRKEDNNYLEYYDQVFKPSAMNDSYNKMDSLLMKSKIDLKNMIDIGVNKNKLIFAGPIKSDLDYVNLSSKEKNELRKELNIKNNDKFIVAGSVAKDEEEIIINSFSEILKKNSSTKLIIAPRYLEQVNGIKKLIKKQELEYILYSEKNKNKKEKPIIILDTFGILAKIYGLGTLAILGDSFLWPGGGHNILEPIVQNIPVIFGRYYYGYKEYITPIRNKYPFLETKDSENLVKTIDKLLKNPSLRKKISEFSKQQIPDNKKITKTYLEYISKNIK